MSLLGPFDVAYPVAFRSGGDTTRVAFGKHIQEIKRIYGILNALDAEKLSASDLNGMLDGFKPKLTFDDISGTLNLSRTTGSLDGSRISGQIAASKIYGNLSNANIDAGRVNGLSALIKSLIPASSGEGEGITDIKKQENGYAIFNNGLIIQWGISDSTGVGHVTFPVSFSTTCFIVVASTYVNDNSVNGKKYGDDGDSSIMVNAWNKSGFGFYSEVEDAGMKKVTYIAIGF